MRDAKKPRPHDGNAALESHHGPHYRQLARLRHEFLLRIDPVALPLCFQVVFYIIVCCMAPFMPESPRYLCATDQIEKAAISLAALRGGYPDTPEISRELEEIRYTVTIEARETGSWSDVFRDNGISGSPGY
jgi:hypothetical protein